MPSYKVRTYEVWHVEVEYTVESNNMGNAVALVRGKYGEIPYDDFGWDDSLIKHIIEVEEIPNL